jgi:hypothetical protein
LRLVDQFTPISVFALNLVSAAAIPAIHLYFTAPGANLLPAAAEIRQVETALAKDLI